MSTATRVQRLEASRPEVIEMPDPKVELLMLLERTWDKLDGTDAEMRANLSPIEMLSIAICGPQPAVEKIANEIRALAATDGPAAKLARSYLAGIE